MSLRRVSEEAGLYEPLNNTTHSGFGTRQLRTECSLLRRRLIGSEGRFKELMRVSDEIGRREEQMNSKVRAQEGEKEAIKLTSQKQK